jgi:hypothetical protein
MTAAQENRERPVEPSWENGRRQGDGCRLFVQGERDASPGQGRYNLHIDTSRVVVVRDQDPGEVVGVDRCQAVVLPDLGVADLKRIHALLDGALSGFDRQEGGAVPLQTRPAVSRDVALARDALALWDAADGLETLLDEAMRNGYGLTDWGDEWPKDLPGKALDAFARAREALRKTMIDREYWANNDDDMDELRPE